MANKGCIQTGWLTIHRQADRLHKVADTTQIPARLSGILDPQNWCPVQMKDAPGLAVLAVPGRGSVASGDSFPANLQQLHSTNEER